MDKLPEQYKQYQWVADMFSQIDGVEIIALYSQAFGQEINLMMTNNRPGINHREFSLPLKTDIIIDYVAATNCNHEYDVNTFPDIDLILQGALAKAKVLFEGLRPN